MTHHFSSLLTDAEMHYTALFEALQNSTILLKADAPRFTVVAATSQYLQDVDVAKEELLGKGVFEAFPANTDDPNDTGVQDLRASLESVLMHKQPHQLPAQRYDVKNKEGIFSERHWKVINSPLFTPEGAVAYIVHAAVDITNEVLAEQKAESSKIIEKAYNFFMSAPVIIGLVQGNDYMIEMANEGLLEVWGRTSDVIGKPLLKAIPELEEQGFIGLLDQVRKTGQPFYAYNFPITLNRHGKDEVLYFDFVYKPYYENENETIASGVISVGHDVTTQVLAEKQAAESETKYRILFDSMNQGFCLIDVVFDADNRPTDYQFLEANPLFENQTGLVDAVGKTARQLVPDLEAHWVELYGKVALNGESIRFAEKSDAMGRWFDVFAFKIGGAESRKVALLFTDITERKKTEDTIRQSEGNLRNIILQSPVAMCILDGPTFIIQIANNRMYEIWAKSAEEALGKPLAEVLPEVGEYGLEALLQNVFATGETYYANEVPFKVKRNKKEETLYLNFVYEPFRNGEGLVTGVMAIAIEVTDEVAARNRIEENNKEFQFVTDFMPQMIWVTKPDGYHYYYNKQWYDYTGLTYGETEGEGWNDVFHPDDRERAWKVWRHSLETGEPYEIEYRCRRFDGEHRWFLGRALALKDESGNILKWFGTCTDIHDQRMAAELMEEKIRERTKDLQAANDELEEFTFVSHHDLQEPLRKIMMFTGMIKSDSYEHLTPESQRRLDRVGDAAQRMSTALKEVLDFASLKSEDQFKQVDLKEVLASVLSDLELMIVEKGASIRFDSLPSLNAVPGQMHQMFYNLLNNALKFSKTDQKPIIDITSRILPQSQLSDHPELNPKKQYFEILVRDNGIGFHQEFADKIFGMFQRLHSRAVYAGTGIGLALVKKVISNHKGLISAEGRKDQGAVFKILLPKD